MVRVMTEEEVEKSNKELDEWIMNLDYNTKQYIRSLLAPFIEMSECEHDLVDPNTYENSLDKNIKYCRYCVFTQKINKL